VIPDEKAAWSDETRGFKVRAIPAFLLTPILTSITQSFTTFAAVHGLPDKLEFRGFRLTFCKTVVF